MASSGPVGPATDPTRQPRRGTTPNEEGLRALGSMIEGNSVPGASAGSDPELPPDAGIGRAGGTKSTGTFDETGLKKLGDEIKNGHKHKRHSHRATKPPKRYKKTKRVLLALVILIVASAGSIAGYAYYLNHELHRLDVKGLIDSPTTGADAGTENILMVGSTDRCALTVQNPAYGLCSQGVNGVNSDVIMILHLDPNKHTVSILSIPRDLFVPNARTTGANKIDAALYQGPSQLVAAINQDFGIPIQHYVVLNFDTFANVVNALGGVKMYFPMPVFDAYSGLNQQTTGCVALDGLHALQVVRARHLQYKGPGVTTTNPNYWPFENSSDLARIRRDHEFLRVMATAVAKNGLSNPITDTQLVNGVASQLSVDSKFSISDMINLVLNFHGVNAGTAPQYTLPVQVSQTGDYLYKGGSYGSIEFPAAAQDQQVIQQFLGINTTTDSMHGGKLPAPGSVTVSVMNGSGATNQATTTSAALGALGFTMTGVGDVTPVGSEAETVVYYAQMTPAAEAAAQLVASSISGAVIMAFDPTQVTSGAQVTVVTGTQFSVNPPAASGSATTVGTGASTTTSTTSGAFQAPSAAVTPLQPWDPRSCTASGGEGP
ncbi:MAG TPA: LCP family protein [Acidimicrobiales bacterium]|jgi:LCP family protein required for cell wall assembly|nr:LCP family protein [Acidimicrobiales bacterium]